MKTLPAENRPGVEKCGAGRGVPDNQISIQLYTFAEYIGFGSDEATWDAELADSRTLGQGWAVAAGVDVPRLLGKYGDRIDLLHVKDGTEVDGEFVQAPLGAGEVDLRPILAAAKGKVRFYVFEQDPIFFGEVDTMLDEARTSFRYLDCVTS